MSYDKEKEQIQDSVLPISHLDGDHEATNEDKGFHRSLTSRHVGIIALASSIGTGLFLGSGSALKNAGPLGILLGYAAVGLLTCAIALMTAEMAAFIPRAGGTTRHVYMFVDRALGIANGWNFAYSMAITAPAELTAASSLIAFWRPDLNLAIFISVFMVIIIAFNFSSVRVYGETEFVFGVLKILLIVGLILAGLIVDWGGSPSGEFIGGKHWREGAIKEYIKTGSAGRFLAFWSTLTNAAFALINIQIVATAGAEVQNPRKAIPTALKRVFIRIIVFYLASLLVVGLILSSNDPRIGLASGTSGSPFVLAFESAGIKALPSIINAIVITSAFSSGNGCVFLASRTIVGLAHDGAAPKLFLKTNRWGSPYWAVALSCIFMPLAYLECSTSNTPALVFNWFVNLVSVAGLMAWFIIAITFLRFQWALKRLGVDRSELPYRAPMPVFLGWFSTIFSFLIIFFSGYTVFLKGNFTASGFLSNYINAFVLIGLYIVLKFTIKSPFIKPEDMGIVEELEVIRQEREEESGAGKLSIWRRIVDKVVN
ncbi:hypothetical protein CI109_101366 [Kwoniella shandongensis]|uniref:Uncharacterized protein n=1 Tax=Kwoniella shandongensis TaxID=1734106 RepID=A0A5M6BUS6_9TREE|nr:uncharacterized protein CI109_005065 [Kwoniella shandongensis]KAA5526493.1 hypothetical protein CI109_005065 [Kwoniella shandongensis]